MINLPGTYIVKNKKYDSQNCTFDIVQGDKKYTLRLSKDHTPCADLDGVYDVSRDGIKFHLLCDCMTATCGFNATLAYAIPPL